MSVTQVQPQPLERIPLPLPLALSLPPHPHAARRAAVPPARRPCSRAGGRRLPLPAPACRPRRWPPLTLPAPARRRPSHRRRAGGRHSTSRPLPAQRRRRRGSEAYRRQRRRLHSNDGSSPQGTASCRLQWQRRARASSSPRESTATPPPHVDPPARLQRRHAEEATERRGRRPPRDRSPETSTVDGAGRGRHARRRHRLQDGQAQGPGPGGDQHSEHDVHRVRQGGTGGPPATSPPPPPPTHPHAQVCSGEEVTCLALVADDTAAAHFLLWGGECGVFEPGDIVRLTGGIFSYHRGNALVLFITLFVETPNMSEIHWGRDPGDPRRMVQEAVVSPYSQLQRSRRALLGRSEEGEVGGHR
ncbi:hypothetical protein GQ55_8G188300 [Panicum hallii var. hallii]|uniref:Uncharacterized protein n=1 Tax=Panicum hallii var. hallii TaxID=1504633 RepID=A0A2T7CNX2_9POAL|nr:hypothetical protein GQ55_8G188300 [Panicum hallii var. hallii]